MGTKNYLLIKQCGLDARGRSCTAWQSSKLLLDARVWPLWDFTRNRKAILAADRLAIYLAGTSEVIATARVNKVAKWNASFANRYPLMLDGTPMAVLLLDSVEMLQAPVQVRLCLKHLSFINQSSKKWGVAFMGGARAIDDADFGHLTRCVVHTA